MAEFKTGETVEIRDTFNGNNSLVCKGKVTRLTKSQIIVTNEHGNEVKFRTKDNLQVGYAWPQLTLAVRPRILTVIIGCPFVPSGDGLTVEMVKEHGPEYGDLPEYKVTGNETALRSLLMDFSYGDLDTVESYLGGTKEAK